MPSVLAYSVKRVVLKMFVYAMKDWNHMDFSFLRYKTQYCDRL